MSRKPKQPETYSIVIVSDNGDFQVKADLGAEEVKATLANLDENQGRVAIFAGPEVKWSSEIVLHAADAPAQKPAEKRKYVRKSKPVEVMPPKLPTNGAKPDAAKAAP